MAARLDPVQALLVGAAGALALIAGLLAGVDPPLSLELSAGAAYALLVFANLPAALALFCSEPLGFSFQESGLMRLATTILLVSWIGMTARDRRARTLFTEHPGMSGVLLVFLAWALLSLLWAADPGASWDTTSQYAAAALLFLVTFTVVETRRQAGLMCGVFVVGAVAAATYGLLSGTSDGDRLAGFSLDPNELGSMLVAATALSIALLPSVRRSPALRIALCAAAVFCVVATFLTVSRGAALALLTLGIAGVAGGGRWRPNVLFGVIAIALISVGYFATLAPRGALDRLTHASEGQQRVQNGRGTIWQVGWRIVEANPVKGVGAGNFRVSASDYVLQPGLLSGGTPGAQDIVDIPRVAHNSYLELLTGLGAVGLGLFLVVDLFAMAACLKAARLFEAAGDVGGEALARGLLVAQLALQVTHLFNSEEASKQFWFLLGLGPALLAIAKVRAGQATADAAAMD